MRLTLSRHPALFNGQHAVLDEARKLGLDIQTLMIGKSQILVVDDDRDKGQMLEMALGMEGYEVQMAANGREALSAMESFQPDLVVSDVMMPELDGYELARRIRENPRTRFIPIILQSAVQVQPAHARLGAEVGALGFITDPTDLKLLVSQVRTLLDFRGYLDTCEEAAFTDHTTGLANRRRFERQLQREIERTARYCHPFCLLLLDIDNFKQVNDTLGHLTGDEAIRHLAKTLQAGIRGTDLAARIGGDEFALILAETDLAGGFEIANRLRKAIKATEIAAAGSGSTTITASFGIVVSLSGSQTAPELVACADAALYAAKRQGRDRVIRGDASRQARPGVQRYNGPGVIPLRAPTP